MNLRPRHTRFGVLCLVLSCVAVCALALLPTHQLAATFAKQTTAQRTGTATPQSKIVRGKKSASEQSEGARAEKTVNESLAPSPTPSPSPSPSPSPTACATPPANLISWYPADGNAADIQGNHNGAFDGTYTIGKVRQAFSFDGTTGVVVPDDAALDFGSATDSNADLSLDAWIQTSDTSSPVLTIVDKRSGASDSTTTKGYALFLANGMLGIQLGDGQVVGSVSYTNYFSASADLRDGTFHLVAVTVQRSGGSPVGTFYVDGVAQGTFDPSDRSGDLSNDGQFLIGKNSDGNSANNFIGAVDETELFGRALTADEVNSIYNAGSAGKCRPNAVTVTPAPVDTPTDNDYTRINNAVQNAVNGETLTLNGTFDWRKPNAAASWALGSDGVANTGDEYGVTPPDQLNNVTFTAETLGSATIQGPGDITGTDATFDLEGVLTFFNGTNQNWTISNINFFDFDLAIGFFNGAGIPDNAYNGTHLTNNHIRMAADSTADAAQNIGILYGFGTNQTINGNTIDVQGNSMSDSGNDNFAAEVAMQSNTSGGAIYDELQITTNVVRVLHAPAADPELVLGIWENGHAHQSDITVSGNTYTHDTGVANTADTNNETGFVVTSHSSTMTTVKYETNSVTGASFGFQWLPDQPDYAGNQPVQLNGNTITGNSTGVNVLSQGVAQLTGNNISANSNGLLVEEQSNVGATGNDINSNTTNGVLVRDQEPSPSPSPSPSPLPSPTPTPTPTPTPAPPSPPVNGATDRSAQSREASNLRRSRSGVANVKNRRDAVMPAKAGANFVGGSLQSIVTLTSNNILTNATGVRVEGSSNSVTLHFNHIFANTVTGINNTGGTTVNAENNFFGCNGGPGATNCDSVTGNVDYTPFLVLRITATPNTLQPGGTSIVTADLTQNSDGVDTSAQGTLPPTPVHFTATGGTITPMDTTTTNGKATATFTSTSSNSGSVSATVDNQTVTIAINVVTPSISINDVFVSEPVTGTSTATFTVTLSSMSNLPVTVQYSTMNGTATAPADYTAIPTMTLTFAPGETTKTISVTINADGVAEGNETFFVNLSNPMGAIISDSQGRGTITDTVTAGQLIITEFRFRGAQGARDEFVELFNNTNAVVTVATTDGSAGWRLANSSGSLMVIIPSGTTIPARGHYLVANAGDGTMNTGYSLNAYGTPDVTYNADIADDSGVALFNTANAMSFNAANRLDAAGFTTEANPIFREGAGLAPIGANDGEDSFVRQVSNQATGQPQDTDDNATDFRFVATNAGTFGGVAAILGAPGPEGLNSPTLKDSGQFPAQQIDPLVSRTSAPNRQRYTCTDSSRPQNCDPNKSANGFFAIRRKFTNNTGAPVTRLRFRIVDITTLNNTGGSTPPVADLRALTSMDSLVVTTTNPSGETIQGTTLEEPPVQSTKGGGLNSTLVLGTLNMATPLAQGNTVNVQFLLGVMQGGTFRFFVSVEAAP